MYAPLSKHVHFRIILWNRWLFFAALYIFALLSFPFHAFAQQVAGEFLEPQRFALIVGNGIGYTGSGLPALGTPCKDVETVAGSLQQMGWTDVVTACDLKTSDLREKIYNFTTKVVRTKRAFGLFYYSGHAAEINGSNYLFGVDADVDVDQEVSTIKDNPDASLFGESAVNIDFELTRLNNTWGRGVLVILDACRNNPIIDEMQNAGIDGIRYPTKSGNATGVMYAFATSDGAAAPGGPPGSVSFYTRVWADQIEKNGREKEVRTLASRVNTAVRTQTRNRQKPDTGGDLLSPPFFCIAGCPSTADQWASYGGQFYSGGNEVGAADVAVERAVNPDRRGGNVRFGPQASGTKGRSVLVASASDDLVGGVQFATPASEVSKAMTQTIRTDVFWCDGDELADQRRRRAEAIAEIISSIDEPINGMVPGAVRVRVLPKKVNAQDRYKLNDDVVYHDRGAKGELAWVETLNERVSASTGTGLDIRQTDFSSPNYTSVFICDGALGSKVKARVYVQVANGLQTDVADKISVYISQQVPKATLSKGVTVRADSPPQTELRYFAEREEGTANEIGSVMQQLLGHPVPVKFVRGFDRTLAGAPVIELWYGNQESLAQVVIKTEDK